MNIDYEKIILAHELVEKYRFKTHRFILLETHYMGTDIGEDGVIKDYMRMEYILYFNHETRIISSNIDEIIEEIQRRINIYYPEDKVEIDDQA